MSGSHARKQLEGRLSEFFGRKHVFLVGRATTAIYLALKAGGRRGNAILPDMLCPSPANAVLYSGLKPRFCDVRIADYNMGIESLESMINRDTVAKIPVHMFGQPADMSGICELAKKHGAMVIEDVAQAFGGKLDGKMLGSFGDVSVLSFGKILGNGDGGAVMTDSDKLAKAIEEGIAKLPAKPTNLAERYEDYKKYYYTAAGTEDPKKRKALFAALPEIYGDLYLYGFTNDNMERIDTAMDALEGNLIARRRNAARYRKILSHPDIVHPAYSEDQGTFFRYSILLKTKCREVTDELRKRKYDASNLYFVPLHEMYEPENSEGNNRNTEFISKRILNLWVEPRITSEYIDGACNAILETLERQR